MVVSKTGEGDFYGPRVGYEATFTIKRSDFGMDYGVAKNALGDEVTLMVGLELVKPKKSRVDLEPILNGLLPPIAAAFLLVSLGGARLVPLAAAVGLYVAYVRIKQWPALPTELWSSPNGTEWLLWSVIAAQLLSLLEYAKVWRGRLATVSAALLGAFGIARPAEGRCAMVDLDIALHVGGGAVAVALLALGMRSLLQRARPGPWPGVVITVILAGCGRLGGRWQRFARSVVRLARGGCWKQSARRSGSVASRSAPPMAPGSASRTVCSWSPDCTSRR